LFRRPVPILYPALDMPTDRIDGSDNSAELFPPAEEQRIPDLRINDGPDRSEQFYWLARLQPV
jgi:hypothetical protein